jgi:hypothetical protein
METIFERDILYREVWTTPISKLARTYGLSDNGLRKVCIALSIPIPPRGHWQKVAACKPVKTAALPKTNGPTQFFSRATAPLPGAEGLLPSGDSTETLWLRGKLAFEKDPSNVIVVPAVLQDPHPAIVKAAKDLARRISDLDSARRKWESRPAKRPGARWEPELFSDGAWELKVFDDGGQVFDLTGVPLRVSSSTADRALRIWDALIKACTLRGLKMAPTGVLTADAYQEKIALRLTERVSPKVGERKPPTVIDSLGAGASKWPTGELRIMIGTGFATKAVDAPGSPLEEQLNGVLAKALRQIVAQKQRTDRWREDAIVAAAAKLRLEEERAANEANLQRIAEEQECEKALVAESESWVQSANISAYVANVIAVAEAQGTPLGADLQGWVDWATGVAEAMDPTKSRIADQ